MTKSKFNSKFRMSGIRSMIFILIFVTIVCVPVGFAVNALAPEEYKHQNNNQDDSSIIDDNEENSDTENNDDILDTDDEISNEDDVDNSSDETEELKFDKKAQKGLMPGVAEDAFDNIDEGKFVYVVNKNIALADGKSEANILIYNPKQNNFNLSLKIMVNGEEIYKTGILKPNQYIENDMFDMELSKGEYNADIEVVAYDIDTNEKQEVYTDNIKITVTE